MKVLRGVLGFCGLAGIALLLGSYGGALHPVGDSLAVFRLFIAAAVLAGGVVLLLASVRRIGWLALCVAAMALTPIGLAMALAPSGAEQPSLTIYTKNVLGGWGDNAAIIADIRATGADVVMLQELSPNRGGFAEALSGTHPYQHICAFSDWSTMAVLSRWPVDETYCSPHRTIAAAQVAHPDGPIWAVSTHLVWPYPHSQVELLDQALPFLETIEGRVVVAGDFNMVPWGHSVQRIEAATGADRIGRLFTTIEVRGLPLTIDHVLTDGYGETERRPRLGSDHYGLVARIGW